MKNLIFITLLILTSCARQAARPRHFTILHTNDHHGHFWSNRDGEWGLAARATLVASIRKEVEAKGGEVLLLDAGDVNTGTPQSDMLMAEPDFKGMAALHYDAMALGNHEFDQKVVDIRRQEKWAGFPFISANIYSHRGERLFRPYIIKPLVGLKIGILGLTTMDTPYKSKYAASEKVEFRDPVQEAAIIVPQLRRQSDVIIAVTHMGHYPDEKNGPDSPGDVTLARKVNGIDVIVGGHTQIPLFKPDIQNGTVIVQAQDWGRYLGRIDFEYADGKLKLLNYQLIPVNFKGDTHRIPEDPKLLAFLRPYKNKGDKTLSVKVGFTEERLIGDRDAVRFRETNLGNLVTEAYRAKFKADMALTNGGGVRATIAEGDITYEDLLTVMPFANDIVTFTMSGKELRDYLIGVLSQATPGTGGFPQFSGLKAIFHKGSRTFSKLVVANQEIDPHGIYTVATTSFLAAGGDRYPVVEPTTVKVFGYADADVFREYLHTKGTVKKGAFGPFGNVVIKE